MTSCRHRGGTPARRSAAALAALAVLLAGCGEEIPEALTEQAVGVDAEIGDPEAPPPEEAPADDEVAVDDERYPSELPEQLPLPGGMDLVDSSVEDTDEGTRVTLEAVDAGDFDRTVLFFDDELPVAGWTMLDDVEGTDESTPSKRWEIEGFGWTGSVEVRQEGDPNDLGGTTTRVLVELREA